MIKKQLTFWEKGYPYVFVSCFTIRTAKQTENNEIFLCWDVIKMYAIVVLSFVVKIQEEDIWFSFLLNASFNSFLENGNHKNEQNIKIKLTRKLIE